jgi:hypothetical protein
MSAKPSDRALQNRLLVLQSNVKRLSNLHAKVDSEVAALRVAGATWSQIGDAFGVSRQTIHARYFTKPPERAE